MFPTVVVNLTGSPALNWLGVTIRTLPLAMVTVFVPNVPQGTE